MSGLEPLAALSIACSAMQCLSFGHELISLFKRHFQSGSVDLGVADNATLLSRWSLELSGSLASAPKPMTKDESELLDISRKCLAAATELTKVLDEARGDSAKGSFRASVVATARLLRRKSKIERLEKTMQSYQNALNVGLLYRIWYANPLQSCLIGSILTASPS
jgi:hypothetical protein